MQSRAHYDDECMAPTPNQQYPGDTDQRHRTNRCVELCSTRMVAWKTRAGALRQHSQWRRCLVERSVGAKSPRSFSARKLRLDPRISGEIFHLQRTPQVLVGTSQGISSAVHQLSLHGHVRRMPIGASSKKPTTTTRGQAAGRFQRSYSHHTSQPSGLPLQFTLRARICTSQ